MSEVLLRLTGTEGEEIELSDCLSLMFEKERYIPYSTFKGLFRYESEYRGEFSDVRLFVKEKEVHRGAVDYCEMRIDKGKTVIEITSRGYASMTGQTEMVPGIFTAPSLNSFMEGRDIPYVTHEDLPETVNYLFIKEHASLWDAVVNLCLKQRQSYPYIAFTNEIRFSPPEEAKTIAFEKDSPEVVTFGELMDYSHIISDLHMRDTEGTYSTFNLTDSDARALNIVRHKHLNLDRQWLDDPVRGLGYKINFAMRGKNGFFIRYKGYRGEDLLDRLSWDGKAALDISRIRITGNASGIFTKLWCYTDRYCNI